MKILTILSIADNSPILAGSPYGRVILSKMIQSTERETEPTVLLLDFSGIDVATASFLRSAVLGFRDYCVNADLNVIPIVTNASEGMIEELGLILEAKGDAIVICSFDNKRISDARIIGPLEEKQAITLKTVLFEKEVNAVDLEKKYWEQEKIKATGWNNRLVSLVTKGILLEIKRGRQKYYRPVLEMKYGA